jgi:hypothetical protein
MVSIGATPEQDELGLAKPIEYSHPINPLLSLPNNFKIRETILFQAKEMRLIAQKNERYLCESMGVRSSSL